MDIVKKYTENMCWMWESVKDGSQNSGMVFSSLLTKPGLVEE